MFDITLVSAPASHPHILITLPELQPDIDNASRYHVSLDLPDAIFIDRDELIDIWGQDYRAGLSKRGIEWELLPKKIDIERPVRNNTEVSTLRLAFAGIDVLDVPLHARYLEPNEDGTEVIKVFQKGAVKAGWGCSSLRDTLCMSVVDHAPLLVTLPTGRTSDQAIVELATPIIIWLGWIYLVVKMWKLTLRTGHMKTD